MFIIPALFIPYICSRSWPRICTTLKHGICHSISAWWWNITMKRCIYTLWLLRLWGFVFEPEDLAYYLHSYGRNATLAIASDAKYVEEGEAWYPPIVSVGHELTLKHCRSMYMGRVSVKRMVFRRDHCDITTCCSRSERWESWTFFSSIEMK